MGILVKDGYHREENKSRTSLIVFEKDKGLYCMFIVLIQYIEINYRIKRMVRMWKSNIMDLRYHAKGS